MGKEWTDKTYRSILIFATAVAVFVIGATICVFLPDFVNFGDRNTIFQKKKISQLAYDSNQSNSNVIYVRENDDYVPYLVLTNHYKNEQTLLLRKYALPEPMPFDYISSYYPDSAADKYLNDVFINQLTDLKNVIVPAEIEITAKESIGINGDVKDQIIRKVFLLSGEELNLRLDIKEGRPLSYFTDPDNRYVYVGTDSVNWWLRTPMTETKRSTYYVGKNNIIDYAESDTEMYIRPAFCVSPDTKIELRSGIENRKKLWAFVVD